MARGAPVNWRPEDEELREAAVARAAEKGISLNEWLNRVARHAILKGGRMKVTTTTEVEI